MVKEQVQAKSSPKPTHLCVQTYFEAVNMEKACPHIWTVVFNDFSPMNGKGSPAVDFAKRQTMV
jgi:hypothetical protein